MDTEVKLLALLQAAIDLADAANDSLIGAHLSLPLEIVAERLRKAGQPGSQAGSRPLSPG